jgi:hypothetical protein
MAPTFATWNSPATLTPGHYLVGTIPDTFTFEGRFKSIGPIKLMIMSAQDYACWAMDYPSGCYAHWKYWGPSRQIYAVP